MMMDCLSRRANKRVTCHSHIYFFDQIAHQCGSLTGVEQFLPPFLLIDKLGSPLPSEVNPQVNSTKCREGRTRFYLVAKVADRIVSRSPVYPTKPVVIAQAGAVFCVLELTVI
jgi:hypothetical protein